MATLNVNSGKDGLVTVHTSWDSKSPERKPGILYPVTSTSSVTDLTQVYTETAGENALFYLEQGEEASPCSLRLKCTPQSSALITSLLIVSEARTMEVYTGAGEYCGTCRGERHHTLPLESADEAISLYKKYLKLESPSTSCDVKLLSLGGRARVGIGGIVLGLQDDGAAGGSLTTAPGIDLHRVQSMMESMGTTLSPGAQNLMDMVQFQQKNKTDALSGFLPLLLGGGPLAALAKAGAESIAAADTGLQATRSHGHTDTSLPAQSQEPESKLQTGPLYPPAPVNELADMVSSFLSGQPGRRPVNFGPDLLPVLQGVCGQVAQLRIDDGSSESAASAGPEQERCCCQALEKRVERRMDEMEKRLKRHIDQRLDELQHSLERVLLAALPLAHVPQGIKGSPAPDWHGAPGLLNGDA
ncbi:hypothetical protein AAFF_G00331720 [Aldrovandia affinis]|uniref:Uncharacterized protein n=1 Tax=Aldrovandia affinis TaxID=143900 RepID=A0AAD7SLT3_9TELE|nr:hypothetical protein AAFF_G00331720 [Aldrovandia affinis]